MGGFRTMGLLLVACLFLFFVAPEVSARKITVGGRQGWSPSVNYTVWASGEQFYYDDWLSFVYDRNQQNVLEVNKTNYESCNADNFIHNYTTGAGRDVVHLNQTKTYYFISGKGFCYSGMKVAIPVHHTPPPPKAAPVKSASVPRLSSSFNGQILVASLFAVAAVWDAFIFLW